MATPAKKPRQGRATKEQLDAMVDYFVIHPHVATGKFSCMDGRNSLRGSWEELVDQLNSLSKGGKPKDIASWKATWRDNKTKVSEKASKLRSGRSATGNNPVHIILTETDLKILGIIGFDYAEGVAASIDSFPEEQMNVNEHLSEGEKLMLQKVPVPLSCRPDTFEDEEIATSGIQPYEDYEFIEFEDRSSTKTIVQINDNAAALHLPDKMNDSVKGYKRNADVAAASVPEIERRSAKRVPSDRLSVQLSDAREAFQRIEAMNAKTMQILAQASQQQADAATRMAEVAAIMAENNKKHNKIMEKMVDNDREKNILLSSLTKLFESFVDQHTSTDDL